MKSEKIAKDRKNMEEKKIVEVKKLKKRENYPKISNTTSIYWI